MEYQCINPSDRNFLRLLADLGVVTPVLTAIQFDLNIAYRGRKKNGSPAIYTEVHLCDHNCDDMHGEYDCPAANLSETNKGARRDTLASKEYIVHAIDIAAQAMMNMVGSIHTRLSQSEYPKAIIDLFGNKFAREVNLFGGNPEMHPEIFEILAELKGLNFKVNLTTTGGKFFDPDFTRKLLDNPPAIIALSADDLPKFADEIRRLASMSADELRYAHRNIRTEYGQQKKALEAIHVANLSKDKGQYPNFPSLIFNFVLHKGNVEFAQEMMITLGEIYPDCEINPYPAQSAFYGGEPVFNQQELKLFENIVDQMIDHHFLQLNQKLGFRLRPRLHYWLLLKATFLAYPSKWERIARLISGYELWQCFHDPILSARYLQIGGKPGQTVIPDQLENVPPPGGQPGCFWNSETVTTPIKVWDSTPRDIVEYIESGMKELVKEAKYPCAGCGMPRLVFDEVSLFAGIPDETVKQQYAGLRHKYLGY